YYAYISTLWIMSQTAIYSLSLHDALPISCFRCHRRNGRCSGATQRRRSPSFRCSDARWPEVRRSAMTRSPWASKEIRPRSNKARSEEHTSELQSRENLVCRLLLQKNKIIT